MYTLIRLGIFAVVLTVLLLLNITAWIAAVLAAVISLCISILVLRKPREEASKTLYEARLNRGKATRDPATAATSEDEDVEDQAVDARADATGAGTQARDADTQVDVTQAGTHTRDADTPAQSANDNPRPTP